MSYTPFNETAHVIRGNSNQNGIDISAVSNLLQGNEIRDPLRIRTGLLPFIGMRAIRVDENGLIDKSIEINDLGQNIRASTTAFIDTTERWTPVQIIQNDLSEGFLKELVTQQVIDEQRASEISVFEPNGLEVPFSSRGVKASINCDNPYLGSQLLSPKYHDAIGSSNFLDGQESILGLAVPSIQSSDKLLLMPYDDVKTDDADRFGINILIQDADLYDRYASQGFVYANNVRDSIAFGGLKD
jgi:hypothetical protein